jgi:hypothetical protein
MNVVLIPWKMPFEAPHIAWCLPEIQKLILSGKYQQALELSFEAATKAGMPPGTQNHFSIPAFIMNVEQPGTGTVTNYLRTVDFESGEIKVLWEDENGQWERHAFVSRQTVLLSNYSNLRKVICSTCGFLLIPMTHLS